MGIFFTFCLLTIKERVGHLETSLRYVMTESATFKKPGERWIDRGRLAFMRNSDETVILVTRIITLIHILLYIFHLAVCDVFCTYALACFCPDIICLLLCTIRLVLYICDINLFLIL